jgi:hypothetical protein
MFQFEAVCSLLHFLSGFPGRALPAGIFLRSPDFPPPSFDGRRQQPGYLLEENNISHRILQD